MFEYLIRSYADVYSICQSANPETLLDPNDGFASRLRELCDHQLREYKEKGADMNSREIEMLRLEGCTWGLLQVLMSVRQTALRPEKVTMRGLLIQNPYTPSFGLIQTLTTSFPLFEELLMIRDWLEDIAPCPPPTEATTGYWKFTKHGVLQSLRMGNNRDGLVRQMDPDAVNRGDKKTLASEDATYETYLVSTLCHLIRAGQLYEAIEACQKAYQPWRSACIRGSLFFDWKALSTEHRNKEEEEKGKEESPAWQGNRNRTLWKKTCAKAALDSNLPRDERFFYAALAPSPHSLSTLISACQTWEDHLWTHVSVMCEEKAETELSKLGGCFWEGGVEAVEKGVKEMSAADEEHDQQDWINEVIERLEGLSGIVVSRGPSADDPFHVSQLQIILNRTSQLLEDFSRELNGGRFRRGTVEHVPLCRLLCHICLFLRMIDIPVPAAATQVILELYLKVLEGTSEQDLIATYVGALGENAVGRYAEYLASLGLDVDIVERRLSLTRAKDHNLDMNNVACATAQISVNNAMRALPQLIGALPSLTVAQPAESELELYLLRSIEWTTFLSTTYPVALEQANMILRYFLASARVQLAKQLLDMIPPDLAVISEPEDLVTEYLHYRQFFIVWETLDKILACQSTWGYGLIPDERTALAADYPGKKLINQAYDQITNLLTSDWLAVDDHSEGKRCYELVRIRQIYIPALVVQLHTLLMSSRALIPCNLKRVFELVNIAADSRYRVYEDFINEGGVKFSNYLAIVRQAVLVGLEGGGSDPLGFLAQ